MRLQWKVRLMCHCVPRACHVETIVDRLNGVTGPTVRRPLPSAVSSVVTASASDERPAKTAAAELGFELSKPGGLLLRAARLRGGLLIAEVLERTRNKVRARMVEGHGTIFAISPPIFMSATSRIQQHHT